VARQALDESVGGKFDIIGQSYEQDSHQRVSHEAPIR
jgi:hypothetical protein